LPRHTPLLSSSEHRTVHEIGPKSGRGPARILRLALTLALLTLFMIGIQNAYPALTASNLFLLEQISVTGHQLLSTRAVVEASGLEPGLNLFETDLELAQKAVSEIPVVAEALLIRQPPGGLVITVVERDPVALVGSLKSLLGIDGNGEMFELPPTSLDLPVITGLETALASGHRSGEIDSISAEALKQVAAFAAVLKKEAPSFLNSVSEVHVSSPANVDDLQILLMESVLRLRMRCEDPLEQVENLEAYVRGGAFERDRPTYVDLRFRNQVVVGL
jgi:hypothetical protein